ncbi:hypothetical protein [Kitasatospora sp. NPDC096140]|uniref:allene oxide cyclase barrel-like domain-containing protein n=1 Tax=unclassified Kitasatospora TaxID=2633591 RepID=UPI00333379E8
MSRFKDLGPTAAGTLAAVLLCGPSAVAAGPPADHGPSGQQKTFTLLAQVTRESLLHLGTGDAPSQGDQIVFAEDLLRDGEKVGHGGGACTVTFLARPGAGEAQCQVTTALPGGQLTTQGLQSFADHVLGEFDVAITGGTGDFRSAGGFVHGVPRSATEIELTFHLDR